MNLFEDEDNFDWEIGTGQMAAFGTGPSVDNTFGNQNGHYIFIGINKINFFKYKI